MTFPHTPRDRPSGDPKAPPVEEVPPHPRGCTCQPLWRTLYFLDPPTNAGLHRMSPAYATSLYKFPRPRGAPSQACTRTRSVHKNCRDISPHHIAVS